MPCVVLPRAEADLENIWFYIADDNRDAADGMIRKFGALFKKLGQFPNMGRARADVRPKLRSVAIGSYVVFCRVRKDLVEIIRVLHGSRDIEHVFDA